MGFSPDQVDQWEPWQFVAVQRGWIAANSAPRARAPSDDEFRAAVQRHVH